MIGGSQAAQRRPAEVPGQAPEGQAPRQLGPSETSHTGLPALVGIRCPLPREWSYRIEVALMAYVDCWLGEGTLIASLVTKTDSSVLHLT